MKRIAYASTILAGAGAFFAIAAAPAQAHAVLVESFPSAKQHVVTPPKEVKLLFSGRADALYSTVELKAEDGVVLAEATQPKASREMALPAPTLQPGRYQVHYRVLSTDGDIVEGEVDFSVDG